MITLVIGCLVLTFCILMMLLEAMPLSLRSDKRKSAHSHEDLPLSKRIALDRKPMPKYGQSETVNFSGSAEKFMLSGSSNQFESTSTDELALRRKKANPGTKLSLDHHCEEGEIWNTSKARIKHENGLSKADDQSVSEDEDVLLRQSPTCDRGASDLLDSDECSPTPSGSKLESLSRTDKYLTSSNGDVTSQLMSTKPMAVLGGLKKTGERKKSGYDRTLAESASSSLFYGGYMRRMASLNASACVTALMEPEKKTRPHKSTLSKPNKSVDNQIQLKQQESRKLWSPLSSSDDLPRLPSPNVGVGQMEHSELEDLSLSPTRFYGGSSTSSTSSHDADTSKDSDDFFGVPDQVYTLLALATLASTVSYDLDEISFNKLGLLYNGDTIHPAARVFFTSDTDLTLPDRIIPRVVPFQEKFLRSAIAEAASQRFVGKKRKGAKANNGWMTMGDPIKTIEYYTGSNCVTRKYYAGIRRSNAKEVIFIRDSVLIRSGNANMNEEKPYVAKISSIWQEQPGQLMMTVFWYYRPHELDDMATQGLSFQEDELLASQHNDDNSVACIEEKCYVLGTTQYCRFQAYIQSKKENRTTRLRDIVPSYSPSVDFLQSTGHGLSWSAGIPELVHPGLETLKPVEPNLVYLCQRGYNHCAAKVISKAGPR